MRSKVQLVSLGAGWQRASLVVVIAALAMVGCAAPPPQQQQAPVSPSSACVAGAEDVKQVVSVRRQFWAAVNAGQVDKALSLFDDSALVVGPDVQAAGLVSEAARTPEQIRAFFAEKVVAPGYQFNPVGGQGVTAVSCDAAVTTEITRVGMNAQQTAMSISTTLKKVDGRWRLWMLNLGKLP